MLLNNKLCADAGTAECPCYLAEYGKCIVCSRLGRITAAEDDTDGSMDSGSEKPSGPATCSCQWQGVCIYNEYLQNNQCINDKNGVCTGGADRTGGSPAGKRQRSRLCKIQKIKWFRDDLAVMRISVPRGIAEKASRPGSFVFVKGPGAENWFEFPLSVMKSDYEASALELAVKVQGPKSRALLERYEKCRGVDASQIGDSAGCVLDESEYGYIELRGIYRNGLLGAEKLLAEPAAVNTVQTGNVITAAGGQARRILCLAKGVGIAPVANYIRWAAGRHHIDVVVDLDKINREFADYSLGIDNVCISRQASGNYPGGIASLTYGPLPVNMSWSQQQKYDVIMICASEYYQQNIYVPEEKKVISNNHTMCCGEGICGACMCIDGNGAGRRMCKCAHAEEE